MIDMEFPCVVTGRRLCKVHNSQGDSNTLHPLRLFHPDLLFSPSASGRGRTDATGHGMQPGLTGVPSEMTRHPPLSLPRGLTVVAKLKKEMVVGGRQHAAAARLSSSGCCFPAMVG